MIVKARNPFGAHTSIQSSEVTLQLELDQAQTVNLCLHANCISTSIIIFRLRFGRGCQSFQIPKSDVYTLQCILCQTMCNLVYFFIKCRHGINCF